MKLIESAEKLIIWVLVGLLLVLVVLGTIDLAWGLIQTIIEPPFLLVEPKTLFHSFGQFLIILIGLELLKLLKLHLAHEGFGPEVVIEVAIIALCNKVVTLDIKALPPEVVYGIAALLLALSGAYFVATHRPTPRT